MSDDMAGVDMAGQPDPEVVRRVSYEGLWPSEQPFLLNAAGGVIRAAGLGGSAGSRDDAGTGAVAARQGRGWG